MIPCTLFFKASDGRIARVSGAYTGPTQPASRDSGMSVILRCTEGASQADYHELRYSVTDKTGEEKIVRWGDDTMKHYFRFEGQSHHAGEYQNYLEYLILPTCYFLLFNFHFLLYQETPRFRRA